MAEPSRPSDAPPPTLRMRRRIGVAAMLAGSSLLMSLAWLGHLRLRALPFVAALLLCWLIVLPEYALNIAAIRAGVRVFSGAQMAAFRLSSGVVCVVGVSWWVLGESLRPMQLAGFALMAIAMALIGGARRLRDAESAE